MCDECDVTETVIGAKPPDVGGHVEVGVAFVMRTEAVIANVGDED